MGLNGFIGVIALSGVLLLATFAVGLLPLYWVSRRGLDLEGDEAGHNAIVQVMSQFGVGMLLGTSFMLVIPEGVAECVKYEGNVGLNLLLGYLAVYLLDRVTHIIMKRRQEDLDGVAESVDIPLMSFHDLLTHPKQACINILKNNVVFALFIHGISDGVALGTTVNNPSLLLVMLLAIVVHKVPAVLSLSSLMISRQNLPRWEIIANLFAFASSTPIGYIVLSMFNLNHSEAMGWLSGNLLLMSGGSLLYAAFTAFSSGDNDSDSSHDHQYHHVSDPVELPNIRSYKIVQNQSSEQINEPIEDTPEMMQENIPIQYSRQNQLKYDKSVYILCGVILPVIISFIIKE